MSQIKIAKNASGMVSAAFFEEDRLTAIGCDPSEAQATIYLISMVIGRIPDLDIDSIQVSYVSEDEIDMAIKKFAREKKNDPAMLCLSQSRATGFVCFQPKGHTTNCCFVDPSKRVEVVDE